MTASLRPPPQFHAAGTSAAPPSASLLIVGSVGSGKRTLAKGIHESRTQVDEEDGHPALFELNIRTRESIAPDSDVAPADFLVLVCDATKEEDFSDLELTLSTLPVAWWTSSAIVITKTDLRRRAYDGTDIFALCAGYTPHYPIFSTTLSSLPKVAGRIRRHILNVASGRPPHLQGLAVELTKSFPVDEES